MRIWGATIYVESQEISWPNLKQVCQDRGPKKRKMFVLGDRYTIRGDTLFINFAELISDEPNKIEGCATTRFQDLDLNCVIGWFRKI